MNGIRKKLLFVGALLLMNSLVAASEGDKDTIKLCLSQPSPLPLPTAEDLRVLNKLRQVQSPSSQSEVQLSIDSVYCKAIRWAAGIAANETIIDKAIEKERELSSDYYVFYTAVPGMRLFQDVTRLLYQKTVGSIGALASNEFQFLRFNYKDSVYDEESDATQFLLNQLQKNGIINDREDAEWKLRMLWVATNIAFFGNVGFTGESTWYFFNYPQPWVNFNRSYLEQSLVSFGFSKEDADIILPLIHYLQDANGRVDNDLFQIFVPKKGSGVDKIAYMCWRLGVPFDKDFITEVIQSYFKIVSEDGNKQQMQTVCANLNLDSAACTKATVTSAQRTKLMNSSKGLTFGVADGLSYPQLRLILEWYSQQWKEQSAFAKALTDKLMNNVSAGMFYPSTVLTTYVKDPTSLTALNYYQARILITNEMLLNPTSGIKIYRYSKLDKEQEARYEKALTHTVVSKLVLPVVLTKDLTNLVYLQDFVSLMQDVVPADFDITMLRKIDAAYSVVLSPLKLLPTFAAQFLNNIKPGLSITKLMIQQLSIKLAIKKLEA